MIEATLCLLVRGDESREILLGKKKRGFGEGKLNGFGGKVAIRESLVDCVIREVREEVGLVLDESGLCRIGTLTFRFPSRPEFDHRVHVFLTQEWHGEPVETEEMAPFWFSVDDIPFDRMWQDDAYWLPIALQGHSVDGEFEYGEDNETVVAWRIQGEVLSGNKIPKREFSVPE
jgi:8-oxo-dGTP pyrophosphatase MutT (NUDIX family)